MDHRRNGVSPLNAWADLHLHSTASDGTLAPSEVVRLAVAAGLHTIALTDHDTLGGVAEARRAGAEAGVRVIPGCEFSVRGGWGELHLLGYFLPDDDPALLAMLERFRHDRAERGRAIVAAVNRCGVALDYAAVEEAAAGAPVGRPHVARALIASGAVRTLDEAFDRLLGRGRPAYVPKRLPELEEVTREVRRVGGVSSVAHPKDRATAAVLRSFQARGVDGIEVRHPSHSDPVRRELERLATELGLLPTGGSDSHGERTPTSSHNVVGGERIPLGWVDALERLARSRRGGESEGG